MKFRRRGAILAVILLLLVVVGIDRRWDWSTLWVGIGGGERHEVVIGGVVEEGATEQIGVKKPISSDREAGWLGGDSSKFDSQEGTGAEASIEDSAENAGAPNIAPLFHVLSSEQILGTEDEPSERQKELLLQASAEVVDAFPPGTILFDLDTRSDRGMPIVLYTGFVLDLTRRVEIAYQRLSEEPIER